MKTSLIIEDSLFRAAQKESITQKTTISETISYWARVGRSALRRRSPLPPKFKTHDLGGPAKVDINNRREWMDVLDDTATWRAKLARRS